MCTGVRIINVKTAFGCNVDDNDNWHTDGKYKQSECVSVSSVPSVDKNKKKQQLIFNQLISLNLDRCRAFYLRLYREIPRRCALSG